MPAEKKIIAVPEPEPGSYKPDRAPGTLLRTQVLHIRETLLQHLAEVAKFVAIDPRSLTSEGAVSEYVARAAAILHTDVPPPAPK